MTDNANTTGFTGHEMVDERGVRLGTIVDVVFNEDGTPDWGVVNPGPFRTPRWVPMDGVYRSGSGRLVSPITAEQLKRAPKAKGEHVLGQAERDQLRRDFSSF